MFYMPTSAKTNNQIDELFLSMGKELYENLQKNPINNKNKKGKSL